MNLILIGMMGGGKTTIGRKLANRLGYHFLDMDEQIESDQNCSISEIFSHQGEEHFRHLETELLNRLLLAQNTVIATGGGVVVSEGNFDVMKRIGTIIYIKTSIEDIKLRLKSTLQRPLLQTANPEERIHMLLLQRAPLYEQADQIVETKDFSPQYISSLIIQNL